MWLRVLAWIRKIPLVGWLAVAVAALWVIARRALRRAAVAERRAEVGQALLANRRALFEHHVGTERHADVERAKARAKLLAERQRLITEQGKLARLSGQALADEINRVFSRPPGKP